MRLHVCIANVHLNSIDNIYCTFEKLFFYTLSLPLPAVSAGMAHIQRGGKKEGRGRYTERREEGREGEIYREAGRRKGGGDIQRGGKKEGRGRYTERREEGREVGT